MNFYPKNSGIIGGFLKNYLILATSRLSHKTKNQSFWN
jgi:hypothetical protein